MKEEQIQNLRKRVNLIKMMQLSGAVALIFCVACMFLLFLDQVMISEVLFSLALFGMAVSLILLILEIRISIGALDIQLKDLEGKK